MQRGYTFVKRLLACIFCGIVLAALQPSLMALHPAELQNNNQETLMLFAQQVDDPVHILQASFRADNTLLDALVENRNHQKITSYRLAWFAIKKEDVRFAKGEAVTVTADVDTTATFSITGQGCSTKADLARHPAGLVFFIEELQFQDGTQWQADPKKMRKEATSMVK
jgi:hypothetical protein